jgi:hypothetical protein
MLAVISVLIGAVLGLRFKVLVLLPAIAATLGPILIGGVAGGHGVWHVALAGILATTGVQFGYLGGSATRHLMLLARASRRGRAWPSRVRSLSEPSP